MDNDDDLHIEFPPRMSDADALMWNIEKDPLLRSTILMVMVLEGEPDRDRLRRRLDRISRLVPRMRQRVVSHPYSIAPPRWDIDPNFDLDYHVRFVRAPGTGSQRELFDIAEPIAMQGFDRARPLWEMTLVEGLADGRSALVVKIHHAITDGVGGMKLQMELVDLEADPQPAPEDEPLPPAPEPTLPGEPVRVADAVVHELGRQGRAVRRLGGGLLDDAWRLARDPVGVTSDLARTTGSVARLLRPATAPLSPLLRERSLSMRFDTLQVSLPALKGAARTVKGHLNDAFVAGVARGMRHYHDRHGHPEVGQLRMTMPINIRDEDTAAVAGNQFVPARFVVPIDADDAVQAMSAIRSLVERERAEPALALTDTMAYALNRLPVTATTAVFGSMLKGVDMVTSNVPGAPVPVYIVGQRMESQIAFGPMTGAATNLVLLSYLDDVHIGINTDPAAIPDPDVFVECMRDGFDEIVKLA